MEKKRIFMVLGHGSPLDGEFSLKDLPGHGRVDELVRCITSSLLLSNDIRRDTSVIIVLQCIGKQKMVSFDGESIKHLNPDERSTAVLLKKALTEEVFIFDKEVLEGVTLLSGDYRDHLEDLQKEYSILHLIEDGMDAFDRKVIGRINDSLEGKKGILLILSDTKDLTEVENGIVKGISDFSISLGSRSIHSHQAITVINNLLDRELLSLG